MKNKTFNNILINMDDIFDSRLVMLYHLNEDTSSEIFTSNKYDYRITDQFGNIPYTLFKEFYKRRSNAILTMALPTRIIEVINTIKKEVVSDIMNNESDIKLFVNTYPYEFTKEELENFKELLNRMFNVDEVELITLNKYDTTPKFIIENDIRFIIDYEGFEWLELHTALKSIISYPLVDRKLYIPALMKKKVPGVKVSSEMFKAVAKANHSTIELIFVDVLYFNTIKKKKR